VVIRFEGCPGGKSKDIRPYHYTAEGWREGDPKKDDLPLYNLKGLRDHKDAPVLIVEGEKSQEAAAAALPEYVCMTWAHGTSSVQKSDWSPLHKRREIIIWPDADEPGLKAARQIQRRLPQARILRVEGRPQGWDVADLVAEGGNPAAFIAEAGVREPVEEAEGAPFVPLGYSDSHHVYLIKGQRVPMSVARGQWTQSKVLELAPLAFWSQVDMTTDNGSIRVASAQDFLGALSAKAGRYWPELLRGAGVWREVDGRIVVNDGAQIVLQDGSTLTYEQHKSGAHYLSSEVRFGDLQGEAAKAFEGQRLLELFEAQNWTLPVHALIAMGWSLIAPFGGILGWRPHIWVSGRKGTGKSWVLENLIRPLCGSFAYVGTGKDTEAGIRRSLRTDARPVVLDEMEPGDRRSEEKVKAIITLARNASCDSSERITIVGKDGEPVQYRIRSLFCLASINALDYNAAVDSRIIRLELRSINEGQERSKEALSRDYADVRVDMGRFLRRLFLSLPRVLADIDYLRRSLVGQIGDTRQVDQLAPILAAVWAACSDESIDSDAGREWIDRQFEGLAIIAEERVEDEDRVIEHILSATARTDEQHTRTVAELLRSADNGTDPESSLSGALLSRMGLKLLNYENGQGTRRTLAIASNADALQKILAGTPYEHGYDAQLRRHPLCITASKCRQVRMALGKIYCRYFDWEGFQAKYLSEAKEGKGQGQADLWEGQ
jgi:putative DNA primase/helicase